MERKRSELKQKMQIRVAHYGLFVEGELAYSTTVESTGVEVFDEAIAAQRVAKWLEEQGREGVRMLRRGIAIRKMY